MANSNLLALSNMFGVVPAEREIVFIKQSDIVDFKYHVFKPSPKAKIDALFESIKEFGILEPVILRPKEDIPYEIAGKYESLAGHQRRRMGLAAGYDVVPAIIMRGLSEEEAYQIHIETNWPRWEEIRHSDRALMLASHYEALKNRNVRKEVLTEINSYLQTLSKPVNSMADDGLSQIATEGVRGVAKETDLSKDMIARYLRINTLIDDIKVMLDDGELGLIAAVELSYISKDNQELFVSLIRENEFKCDIKKAKLIREEQQKGKLTVVTMTEILSGIKVKKKPGKPAPFKMRSEVIYKYFNQDEKQKDIEDIIDKALELYFTKDKRVLRDRLNELYKEAE